MSDMFEVNLADLERQIIKFKFINRYIQNRFLVAMKKSVVRMTAGWKEVAPVDTTLYKSTLKQQIEHNADFSVAHGQVSTNAKSPKGFPYPVALEESTRYHYRRTRRRGQRTAGQVGKMFRKLFPFFQRVFVIAQHEVTKDLEVK